MCTSAKIYIMTWKDLAMRIKRAILSRLRSERQESEAMGGLCQGRPAVCRAFNYMVEETPTQGRLEGCHRMSAATHLICGLESV